MGKEYFFSDEQNAFRDMMSRFVEKEIKPNAEKWEEQGCYDKAIFKRMGDLGLLGINYPVEYGGQGADLKTHLVFWEELCRSGISGFAMSVMVHTDYGSASLVHAGSPELKEKYVKDICSGEKLFAIGITEPNHGSDVATIETRAKSVEDCYSISGSKMFITNGTQADVVNTVVRTGGPGVKGVSLVLVDTDTEGFSVGRKLNKMGMLSSDTAELVYEDCVVPKENLIGEEGKGFYYLMAGLERERLSGAVLSYIMAELALEDSIEYAKTRIQFGTPIISYQAINHMIAEMATEIEAGRQLSYHTVSLMNAGVRCNKEASMAKYWCAEMLLRVVDKAVQIHGGYGFIREYRVERLYRDAKLQTIGGGTNQIMRNVIVAEMGLRVK